MKKFLKSYQVEDECSFGEECDDDLAVIHKSAGILRREMESLVADGKRYPSAQEIDLEASERTVSLLIAQKMLWFIDNNAYDAGEAGYRATLENKHKNLSLAKCLIFNNKKTTTPLHLGLAVQLHHEYGKRGLIDTSFRPQFFSSTMMNFEDF